MMFILISIVTMIMTTSS